jgi:hypothetical protein
MDRVVDPILTDIEIESTAAACRGERWASRWIRAAGAIALLKALALYGWTRFSAIREWPIEDRRVVRRSVGYTVVATCLGVLLLELPLILSGRTHSLVPVHLDAVPVALPAGLFVGLVYALRSSVVSLRPLAAALAIALFCSIASLAALGWIAPLTSKAYRIAATGNNVSPNEMTFGELRIRIAAEQHDGHYRTFLASNYHNRWALAAAPVVLTGWAFLVVGRLSNSRWVLGVVAVATYVAYVLLMVSGRMAVMRYGQPPMAGAWLPNAVFLAALILLVRRTSTPRATNGTLSHQLQA